MKLVNLKTAEEYKDLVSKYSWLVDSELLKIETVIKEHPDQANIEALPKLISLVNVVGYLRGQDGAFLDIRPDEVTEYQRELYDNEDAFESRLREIIKTICVDPKNIERYKAVLDRYFLKARLPN
jgi:hypothetical protein